MSDPFKTEVKLFNQVHTLRADIPSGREPMLRIRIDPPGGYAPRFMNSLSTELRRISAMSNITNQKEGLVTSGGNEASKGLMVLLPDNNVPPGREVEFLQDVMTFLPDCIEQASRITHHNPDEPDTGIVLDDTDPIKPHRPPRGPIIPGNN